MNPLIRKKGICDPHIHIYEGKAYLYATHDVLGYEEGFCMEDWHIYSSEDLIEWKQERILRPEDFYCGALNQCWAVDAVCRDGKYYWYFSTGSWGVGVGVSSRPAGPFEDALGGPVRLNLYVNGVYQKELFFPVTGQKKLDETPHQLRISVMVNPGVNMIKVVSENGFQQGALAIDHIVLETEKSHCKAYAAANGIVEPKGNGCWNHLPQRECDTSAFSGRAVKYLGTPGDSVKIISVDGGKGGGHILEIRYSRAEDGESLYELEINGSVQTQLKFPRTGSWNMRQFGKVTAEISLEKGKENTICLRKAETKDKGITVDAFAVIPPGRLSSVLHTLSENTY